MNGKVTKVINSADLRELIGFASATEISPLNIPSASNFENESNITLDSIQNTSQTQQEFSTEQTFALNLPPSPPLADSFSENISADENLALTASDDQKTDQVKVEEAEISPLTKLDSSGVLAPVIKTDATQLTSTKRETVNKEADDVFTPKTVENPVIIKAKLSGIYLTPLGAGKYRLLNPLPGADKIFRLFILSPMKIIQQVVHIVSMN